MRTLAIGDIHGCLKALETLLAEVQPAASDRVVLLGDYVDRGPDSRGVLERLIALKQECRLVTLLGNHDLMFLSAGEDLEHFEDWLGSGGKQTLQSYQAAADIAAFPGAIPTAHLDFLRDHGVPYFETATHIFVHANLYPDLPLDEQPDYMLHWERLEPEAWRPHESGKTMICGHSSQRSGRPLVLERAACIDTWVYGDGWLTCLDIDRQAYWQANQAGMTRQGNLGFRAR